MANRLLLLCLYRKLLLNYLFNSALWCSKVLPYCCRGYCPPRWRLVHNPKMWLMPLKIKRCLKRHLSLMSQQSHFCLSEHKRTKKKFKENEAAKAEKREKERSPSPDLWWWRWATHHTTNSTTWQSQPKKTTTLLQQTIKCNQSCTPRSYTGTLVTPPRSRMVICAKVERQLQKLNEYREATKPNQRVATVRLKLSRITQYDRKQTLNDEC